jgi:hypothetical protein
MENNNIKMLEVIAMVAANLRSKGFVMGANIALPEKDEIRVTITGNNDQPIKRITAAKLTNQTKAFHQAIVDLQGAGLWVATSLTMGYNSRLDITINADNIPRSGNNINNSYLAPRNNGVAAPHV